MMIFGGWPAVLLLSEAVKLSLHIECYFISQEEFVMVGKRRRFLGFAPRHRRQKNRLRRRSDMDKLKKAATLSLTAIQHVKG
jgi:hypothetical protein